MKDQEKIRGSIMSAASVLFEKYGYEKTSMDEIASASRKAKATIYYYFRNKLEIFRAVLEQEMQKVIGNQRQVITAITDTNAQIAQYLKSRMDIIREAKVYRHYIMSAYVEGTGEVKEAVMHAREILDEWEYRYFTGICTKGRELGILSEDVKPDAFAMSMLALLKGLEIQFINYEDAEAMRSTYNAMVEILVTNNFNKEPSPASSSGQKS